MPGLLGQIHNQEGSRPPQPWLPLVWNLKVFPQVKTQLPSLSSEVDSASTGMTHLEEVREWRLQLKTHLKVTGLPGGSAQYVMFGGDEPQTFTASLDAPGRPETSGSNQLRLFRHSSVPGAAHAAHRPLIPSHWACHPESGGGGSWATFRVNPFRVPMPAVARETGWDPYPSRQDPSQLCLAPGPTPQEHVSLLRRSGSPTRRGSGLQQPPPAPSTHRPRLRPF